MKLLLVIAAVFAFANARYFEVPEYNTAYGYMQKYGIPAAERVRRAEEEGKNEATRIVGGSPARLGQFPWQAGLISDIIGTTGRGICGGVLVSSTRALTAAHCWFDGRNQAWRFNIVLGSITLFSGGHRIESTNVIMHNNWNPSIVRNDIAVIILPSAVPSTNNIAPVALPSGSQLTENFSGAVATASGFGLTSDNGQITTSQVLSYVSMNVISNTVCTISFPLLLHSSNICTSGSGNKGACQGDSGGPLVVVRNDRPLLVGLTSFGSALGCQRNLPSVFVRITSFMSFIQQHM